jgi:UDP-N-acetylmuramoylalanine--D-glutamate ligase
VSTWLVIGAARSGIAAAEAIVRTLPGDRVVLTDRSPQAGLSLPGVELRCGRDDAGLLDGVEVCVKSPGVPGEAALVTAARSRGIPVWSEVELAYRLLGGTNPIIGVTGTNGKTTTTALLGEMLAGGGVACEVAGNIGNALSTLVGRIEPGAAIACELSSFQLEDIDEFHARVAVLLGVTPDHLDRHRTLERYAACKLRVFERQEPADTAVLCDEDAFVAALADDAVPGAGARVRVRLADAPADLRAAFADSALAGAHNEANALCALTAACAAGARRDGALEALRAFQPLAHRMEPVGTVAGVTYVNDSKATNPDAALRAVESYPGGVRLILGGSLKGGGFEVLAAAVRERVAACYLIGEAADRIAADLGPTGVPMHQCGTLADAVERAARDARPGEVVLLAPACASFGQFRDYAERGDRFRALVEALA